MGLHQTKLIEIKCPVVRGIKLNEEIQAVSSNFKHSYLLIYYKIGDKCLVIKVTYDYEFVEEMISRLHWVYFKQILPKLLFQVINNQVKFLLF